MMAENDSATPSEDTTQLNVTRCPRCEVTGLLHAAPEASGHFSCIRCHGEFLNREQVQTMIIDQLGIDSKMLSELMQFRGGSRLICPQCETPSSAFVLRGFALELCGTCGGIWADHGVILELVNAPPPSAAAPMEESVAAEHSSRDAHHPRPQTAAAQAKARARLKRPVSQTFFYFALALVLAVEVMFVFSLWKLESGTMDISSWLGLLLALAMLIGMLIVSRLFGR